VGALRTAVNPPYTATACSPSAQRSAAVTAAPPCQAATHPSIHACRFVNTREVIFDEGGAIPLGERITIKHHNAPLNAAECTPQSPPPAANLTTAALTATVFATTASKLRHRRSAVSTPPLTTTVLRPKRYVRVPVRDDRPSSAISYCLTVRERVLPNTPVRPV